MTAAAALEIAAAASEGTMPTRAWALASAASTSAQRARRPSSPNAAHIAAVPNMSPNRVDDRTPMVISDLRAFVVNQISGVNGAQALSVRRSNAGKRAL